MLLPFSEWETENRSPASTNNPRGFPFIMSGLFFTLPVSVFLTRPSSTLQLRSIN